MKSYAEQIQQCLLIPFIFLLSLGTMAATESVAQQAPVPENVQVERLANGFQFTEGPRWRNEGYLVFSDIPANTIYRWAPGDSVEVYRRPSGNSNGIAADQQGRLLLAQHGWRRVARVEANGQETALATHYQGKRLNSPNDLTVHSDGSIYFTDPPYGIEAAQEELGFYGVYRLGPDSTLELLVDDFVRPNGIVFSPDESQLYVNDSERSHIRVFAVGTDGTLSNGRIFATMEGEARGGADGMVVDEAGNVYSTGPGGVWIFAPDGTPLRQIDVPGQTTNLAWGGADNRTLYLTSGDSIYRLQADIAGIP